MSHARAITTGSINRLYVEDGAAHDWYRFVLSFPPHLVREYVGRFGLNEDSRVLDPFCGTGTTVVECKKLGVESVGIEANPMAHLASCVKVKWNLDPQLLIENATLIAETAIATLAADGIQDDILPPLFAQSSKINDVKLRTLEPAQLQLLLTDSISPLPLHKTLVLLDAIEAHHDLQCYDYERLALAKALAHSISNLHFGPEVGVGKAKSDARVIGAWLDNVRATANDLYELQKIKEADAAVHFADARQVGNILEPESIDAVITSPPYPNEKDYTRTTRLESVLLGFIKSKADLRGFKQNLLRSNTRTVYKGDDDHKYIAHHDEIERLASEIEAKRLQLGKTSGFEKQYAKVVRLYFGGMARHLDKLRTALRPGAHLAYVVGDQASYFRVIIRTGQLLAQIAEPLGYEIVDVELFRSRLSTATKEQLREEVVVLKWLGKPTVESKIYDMGLPVETYNMADKEESKTTANRYTQIIERIFFKHYKAGAKEVNFTRDEIEVVATDLGINLPKNLGDILYSFRYRSPLPNSIRELAPKDQHWVIRSVGRSMYRFALAKEFDIKPNEHLLETKVPDSTPGLISKYALSDEQALLAKLRYNCLIDIFTGIACYSLQNHLRTSVAGIGQIETDEVYIGVDKRGVHHVFPVQAKGGNDKINVVQIEQDVAMCASKFPSLVCHPVGAQFMNNGSIALFEFVSEEASVKVVSERHYKLVSPAEVTPDLLETYKNRLPDE